MSREGLLPRSGELKKPGDPRGQTKRDVAALMDGLERALAFSRASFRAIVDKSADGIVVLNTNGTICFANPAAEVLLGKSTEELLGEPFGIPVVPGETTEVDILRHGVPTLVAEMRVVETEWQSHDAYLATLRDVTERKRYEQRLARLSAIVESTHHAVIGTSLDGMITSWNKGAERLYGYTSGDAIGQPLSMLIPPQRANENSAIFEQIERGHRGIRIDTVRRRRDGSLVDVSLSISPIIDVYGCLIGISAISSDITQRKHAERELHEAIRRRDEFLAMLSHELRNPLAATLNASAVMQNPRADASAFAAARTVIERQCRQMSRLLDELLDVSRVTRGKIELHRECVDLAEVLHDAIATIAPQMSEQSQWLDARIPRHRLLVDVDPVRMQQVYVNLLSNASKYSEVGGRISVSAKLDGNQVVVRVCDEGVGLTEESLASIFEPFVQVGTTIERANCGLGLGLALVRSLVQLHGGSVVAQSRGKGLGSEFTVRLPLATKPSKPADPEPAPVGTGHKLAAGLRILIVEDNDDVRSMLKALLESSGHDVEAVGTGRKGIETIEFMKPDVALVDIGLPEIDGYEVARQVRSSTANDDVTLVAITGYGQEEDRQMALSAGFDAHLSKPVGLDALFDTIGRCRSREKKEKK